MQARFKTKEQYYEWRTYWRRQYQGVAREIRYYKNLLKSNQFHESTLPLLRGCQMKARSLMMAREAVEEAYRVDKIVSKEPYHLISEPENFDIKKAMANTIKNMFGSLY